jgi:FtsP/CotA-like multicopper oxidase with cupredoxin domain
MNRRQFLTSCAAAALLPKVGLAASGIRLKAEPVVAQILPEGDGATKMLGFNGTTPGPELRVRQGDRLNVTFENGIDEGSAIHWHGIRLPNAMDGVPYLTQPMVEAGESFDYSFVAPDAGTYWYHSHNRSWEQVARGLYGPLIVEELTPPDVDHDITVIIDDWRLEVTGEQMGDFGNLHDFSHSGRLGNYARALIDPGLAVSTGQRLRLRLINTATARMFPVRIEGITGKVVALDGMPLSAPEDLDQTILAPAQRMDIIADVVAAEQIRIDFVTRDEPYELGVIPVVGSVTPRDTDIPALPPNSVPLPDRDNAMTAELLMQGGAMSPLATRDAIWLFNGQSGMTDEPFQTYERGKTAQIRIVNETRFFHGIHLHGHHFFEINDDGSLGYYRDTTLLAPNQKTDILCVFDNPGKWLLHCHMLGHQAAGMKTWLEVL